MGPIGGCETSVTNYNQRHVTHQKNEDRNYKYSQSSISRHPRLEPMEICERKLPGIPYYDIPQQIAVNKLVTLYQGLTKL